MLNYRKELAAGLHTAPSRLRAMSAISRHFPLFPSAGMEGMEFSESPWRKRRDIAEEGAACDGMRFLSRFIVARSQG